MQCLAFCWIFLLLFEYLYVKVEGITPTQYGPSLELLFGAATTAEPGKRKEIYLEASFPKYSVVIPLADGKSTANLKSLQLNGKFTVIAPEDHGVMMVIQALRLRTKVVYSESINSSVVQNLQCRDFLKFESNNKSAQVCGFVSKFNKDGHPYGLLGPRAFLTQESQMEVIIHTDISSDSDFGKEEFNTVELVFTAYKECPDSFFSHWNKLTGSSKTKSCSPSDNSVCIPVAAFCDGSINCGVKGPLGSVGYDEEACSRFVPTTDPPSRKSTTSHRPYIGVSTPYNPPTSSYRLNPLEIIGIFVAVVLLIFGTCTWLARANEKKFQHTVYRFSTLRRSRRNPRQRHSDDTLSNRLPSAPPVVEITTEVPQPTAPVASQIPGEEPPPYHALFPVSTSAMSAPNAAGSLV